MKSGITFLSYIGVMGVGVGIGVLSTRSYFKKMYSDIADSEIESMAKVLRDYKNPEKDSGSDFDETVSIGPISYGRIHDVPSYSTSYSTFSDDVDKAETESPREDDTKKPYFIDIDDFDEATLGYAKKELVYYMDDGTLLEENHDPDLDDEEGIIVSIVDTVGADNLEKFENSLESCCYIRNETLKEDYEISKIFASYGAIMGE